MTATTKASPGILSKAKPGIFRMLDEVNKHADGVNNQAVKYRRCNGCKCRQLKRRTTDESIVESIMPLAIIEPEGLNLIGNNE